MIVEVHGSLGHDGQVALHQNGGVNPGAQYLVDIQRCPASRLQAQLMLLGGAVGLHERHGDGGIGIPRVLQAYRKRADYSEGTSACDFLYLRHIRQARSGPISWSSRCSCSALDRYPRTCAHLAEPTAGAVVPVSSMFMVTAMLLAIPALPCSSSRSVSFYLLIRFRALNHYNCGAVSTPVGTNPPAGILWRLPASRSPWTT